jgi:isopenicillin N synthase-like dioxygenase
MKNLKSELLEYGFAVVPHSWHVAHMVSAMMEAWKEFCSLPIGIKTSFSFTGDTGGSGYEYKDEPGPTKDLKENFHFSVRELDRVNRISRRARVDGRFVNAASSILSAIRSPISEFTRQVEREFDLPGFRDEVNESWDRWTLRLLHYPPSGEVGKVLASPHVDKLGWTMYLKETTPGVQYYNPLGEWVDMPVLTGETIITSNMQTQYKTGGQLKAVCHRVVSNEDSARDGRYSIVCFADFLKTPQYDKERCGRLQDMPLGFNRNMSFEEFAGLFK